MRYDPQKNVVERSHPFVLLIVPAALRAMPTVKLSLFCEHAVACTQNHHFDYWFKSITQFKEIYVTEIQYLCSLVLCALRSVHAFRKCLGQPFYLLMPPPSLLLLFR